MDALRRTHHNLNLKYKRYAKVVPLAESSESYPATRLVANWQRNVDAGNDAELQLN